VPDVDVDTAPLADSVPVEIRTEYHPRSRKYTRVSHPEEHSSSPSHQLPDMFESWSPYFNTREDFLLSEILLEGSLNNQLADRLIKLFNYCAEGKGSCTFRGFKDVENAWEHASLKVSPVS
jgi:hypothetical protein